MQLLGYHHLVQTTPLAQQAVSLLIRRMADPVEEVADAALTALLEYGPHALTQVMSACEDSDSDRARRALSWLAGSPQCALSEPNAVLAAYAALTAESGEVRAQAAHCIGSLLAEWQGLAATAQDEHVGAALARSPGRLCKACRDSDPQVRAAAASALGHCRPRDIAEAAAVLDALQEALGDNSSRAVREAAAHALGGLARVLSAESRAAL